jgi:hypothetical protein
VQNKRNGTEREKDLLLSCADARKQSSNNGTCLVLHAVGPTCCLLTSTASFCSLSVVHQFLQVCQPSLSHFTFSGADDCKLAGSVPHPIDQCGSALSTCSFFSFDHHTGTGTLIPSSLFVIASPLLTLTTTASALACRKKGR